MRKVRILPPIPREKVSEECRKCQRYIKNSYGLHGNNCGGRQGLSICLAFK